MRPVPAPASLYADPVLAVVISDFGRDAAMAFCAALARHERDRIIAQLPAGAVFYDEYRRLTLAVSGDLRFAKAPFLAPFRASSALLDERVLVGFAGGLAVEDVVDRLGLLALEAMGGPVRRGVRQVMVLLPCNTLAPASWALAERFTDRAGVEGMVRRAGVPWSSQLEELVGWLGERVAVTFPTVPGAVLAIENARFAAERPGAARLPVLPLGTLGIADVYAEAARREPGVAVIAEVDPRWQRDVLDAIQACITGEPAGRQRARERLETVRAEARQRHGEDLVLVEACTDLDLGVGINSGARYAAHAVDRVY